MTAEREEALRLLRLAEKDRRAFEILLAAGTSEDFPTAAFHAQQAMEKAIKAILCIHRLEYRRTHDLLELAARAASAGATPPVANDLLQRLTPYAVEFRYDDHALALLTPNEAKQALFACLEWANRQLETGS